MASLLALLALKPITMKKILEVFQFTAIGNVLMAINYLMDKHSMSCHACIFPEPCGGGHTAFMSSFGLLLIFWNACGLVFICTDLYSLHRFRKYF